MMFIHPFQYSRWFVSHNLIKTMVDSQVLERWLEDVALFQAEPVVDYQLNFDDLFEPTKTNDEVTQAIPGLSDLGWLDEKVDLSVFDDPSNFLLHPNDAESLMVEDAANLLLGLVDNSSNFDASNLSSHDFKIEENDFIKDLIVPEFPNSVEPPEVHESHLASPSVNSLQVNSPFFYSPVSSPANTSVFSDASIELSSPQSSPAPISNVDSSEKISYFPEVIVTVCDDVSQYAPEAEISSLEDVTKSFKKKKYVNTGKEVPKIRILMKDDSHPYSVATSRIKDRRERKKVQNKEAAARYRVKRRKEEDLLSDEVTGLECEQKKLQEKHDGLQAEIKYLKSLMREILEKKGVLK